MILDYNHWTNIQENYAKLEIPNRIDVEGGEIICIGWQGDKPLAEYRNLSPDAYYEIVGEDKRDKQVDPWKVLGDGLTDMAERAREKEEDRMRKK